MTPSQLPPRFDLFELLQEEEPYKVYAQLRHAGPLLRGGPGIWVVPRYKEVAALLREPRLGPFQFVGSGGQSGVLGDGPVQSFMRRIVVASSSDDHARVRKVLSHTLNSTVFRQLRERVEQYVDELLDARGQQGVLECVTELAYPLPLRVLSDLVGLPMDEVDEVGRRVLKLSKVFAPIVGVADLAAADEAVLWLRAQVSARLAQRAREPANDLLSTLAAAAAKGLLSSEESTDNAIFLMFAGLETSMNLIAAGCAALAGNAEQFKGLREKVASVATAVEEFLRHDAPTQITARIVRETMEIAGRTLGPGRILLLLLGSANHDEDVFHDAEVLDLKRHPNPHLSFGAGAHYCVGAALARLEGAALFDKLAQRFVSFEPAGEVVREPTATPRIYSRVPVAFRYS